MDSKLHTQNLRLRASYFFAFVKQQALSCLFPVLVFSMLAVSHLFKLVIPRYDFMLIACITIQIVMYCTRIETKDEVLGSACSTSWAW